MSRQYKNFKIKLEQFSVSIITTEEEYINDTNKYKKFTLQCPNGHIWTMVRPSLNNKIEKAKRENITNLCSTCDKPEITHEELKSQQACEKLGFTFIKYDKNTRQVYYTCLCGYSTDTFATNLLRTGRKAQCQKCQNNNHYDDSNVSERFKEKNFILLDKYQDKNILMNFICDCGRKDMITFVHFLKGRKCKKCNLDICCKHGYKESCCIKCTKKACPHDRDVRFCKECPNNKLCIHDKEKRACIFCSPENSCSNCHSVHIPSHYKYYPTCARCYYYLNPNVDIPKYLKFKEHYLQEYLQKYLKNVDLIFDKTLNACSKRRPDVFIECYTHSIIVECDEKQHRGYSCENKRIAELFTDLGNRPLIVIRFNPDNYTDSRNIKQKGCFYNNKDSCKPIKQIWEKRVNILLKTMKHYIKTIPDKEITIIQLYYDGYQE